MEGLKPCPHCNGKAAIYGVDSYYVACCRCEAQTKRYKTAKEAVENWNRRAAPENKPLTVAFPCKIGDTIYEVEDGFPITSYHVTGFVLGKTEFEDYDDVEERQGWQIEYGKFGIDCECPISEFGKSLFLTREAAEQALADRKPEGSEKP